MTAPRDHSAEGGLAHAAGGHPRTRIPLESRIEILVSQHTAREKSWERMLNERFAFDLPV